MIWFFSLSRKRLKACGTGGVLLIPHHPSMKKKKGPPRILTIWEELILTLVRTRKGFDVHFLADTFGITAGHVSRVYNTWITFLSCELSFLVSWPGRQQIRKCLPKCFKKFKDVRIIIDCCEFYIQKPTIPESQKSTWSSYKHHDTVKLLVGVTPTEVFLSSHLYGLAAYRIKKLSKIQA